MAVTTGSGIVELPLVELHEREGGNYRPLDREHVGQLARRFELEGFRPGLGCPNVAWIGGRWVIVSGHHRIAAARSLGWETLPCAVVELAGADLLADQVAENACRREAPATAEARAFSELADLGWSVEKISSRVGRSVAYIARRLDLCRLDESVRWIADRKGLGFAWCEVIADLPHAAQRELARRLGPDMTAARWSALAQITREEAAKEAQGGFFALDALTVETWDRQAAAYVVEREQESAPPAVREQVLGVSDIAAHLGVKAGTAHKWQARGLLPAPDMTVSGQPAWWLSTIDEWAGRTGRK